MNTQSHDGLAPSAASSETAVAVGRDQLVVSTSLAARPPIVRPQTTSPYGGPLSAVSADLGDHW